MSATPIDMLLFCPECHVQHVDEPEPSMMAYDAAMAGGDWPDRWTNPPHRSHLCHACSCVWRPADVPTNGVERITTRGKADTWSLRQERPLASAMTLHWHLLGVRRGAEKEELDAARRQLALQHHPDRNPAGAAMMAAVNVAYDTLWDPAAELRYVAQLRATHKDCTHCAGVGGKWKQKGFTQRAFYVCQHCRASGLEPK